MSVTAKFLAHEFRWLARRRRNALTMATPPMMASWCADRVEAG
jgi:hypothetical protein